MIATLNPCTEQQLLMRISSRAIVATLGVLCVMQITDATAQERPAQPVIEVTLPALAGIVHWIAPDATVQCLLPAGADPHHFHPGPRQIERVQQAGLLLRSSRDDIAWFKHAPLADRSVLDLWPVAHDANDHAWLLPDDVYAQIPHIIAKLNTLSPQHGGANNAAKLAADVAAVNQAWQAVMTVLRQRGVIMQHPSWKPLFEHYQVPILAVLESNNIGHSHGYHAQDLDQALQQLKQHPQALLIADRRHDDAGLKWLQRHHPASHLVYLEPVGSCNQTWPELMQQNIAGVEAALQTSKVD
jgi:ABC-type Zn uptake system ZnuABC Zn-binding protein ZnuA